MGARREGKGIETLLRAVALARGQRPALHLRLVGRAPDDATEMRWRALAAELGLGEAIAFDPPADRAGVGAAMRRAGLFVHPSPSETFGMVAAEALASGLPVAARRSGGVEEVLGGQDVGAELAAGDDAADLADAILRLRSRLPEVDPAALRAVIVGRYAAPLVADAILDQARSAAAEMRTAGPGSATTARSGDAAARRATGGERGRGDERADVDAPGAAAVLVVGLRRATAVKRIAALPGGQVGRLTVVTEVDSPGRRVQLPGTGRWIEVDADEEYAARLAALGGLPDPRRTTAQRLLTAVVHPGRARRRKRLLEERPGMRAAAERRAVLAAWSALLEDQPRERPVIVALGAEDVLAAADALDAGAPLAPGGLRWLADRWDAAAPS